MPADTTPHTPYDAGGIGLTPTRRNALIDVESGYLLDGPELAAAAWLCEKGLIEPAPSHKPNDPVAKRAFVVTEAGCKALDPPYDQGERS